MILHSKLDCLPLISVTLFVTLFTERHPYVYNFFYYHLQMLCISLTTKNSNKKKKKWKKVMKKKDFELNIQTK